MLAGHWELTDMPAAIQNVESGVRADSMRWLYAGRGKRKKDRANGGSGEGRGGAGEAEGVCGHA
jgi:hypothetical protein